MLTTFKDKLKEKRGFVGTVPPLAVAARVGSLSKNPKKRAREGSNTARTYHSLGEMATPPPSRIPVNVDSPPTDDFNRPIPLVVAMPVAAVQQSPLSLLEGVWFCEGNQFQLALQH